MRLVISVKRDGGILAPLSDRLDDPTPVLQAGVKWVQRREADVFRTGNGGSWAPDAMSTLRGKSGRQVLVDKGDLLADLTEDHASSDAEIDYGSDSVTIATRKTSALMAQRGARGAPARNPVPPLSGGELDDLTATLLGALMDLDS